MLNDRALMLVCSLTLDTCAAARVEGESRIKALFSACLPGNQPFRTNSRLGKGV